MSRFVDYSDGNGPMTRHEIKTAIDTEDFRDCAIYPWLIAAANPSQYTTVLSAYLETVPGAAYRPPRWIRDRRKMFRPLGAGRPASANRDGLDEQAFRVMQDNPGVSVLTLSRLLRENGIRRNREWVRRWRYAYLASRDSR